MKLAGAALPPGRPVVCCAGSSPLGRELQRWDEFTLKALTAVEETGLDRFDTASWCVRFG